MSEPITVSKSFIVPNTGDLPAAWGTSALNPNFQTLDALFGGSTTISLAGATTLFLSVPATTGVWPGGLSQSVNAIVYFNGAQSGNAIVGFSLPGFYIVHNQCTGTSYVQLAPSASGVLTGGNRVGAPPGKKCHVFFDGTNMDYVNMPDPGVAYDLHTNTTSLPPWMQACTVSPYLVKDGSTYSTATYPALSQLLGSTYGGDGITTFGVPDERSRMRLPVDTGATGRVTSGISGINGTTFGSAGGSQSLQSHKHTFTGNSPGQTFAISGNATQVQAGSLSFFSYLSSLNLLAAATPTGAISTTGSGGSQNMPPAIVSFLALVKT